MSCINIVRSSSRVIFLDHRHPSYLLLVSSSFSFSFSFGTRCLTFPFGATSSMASLMRSKYQSTVGRGLSVPLQYSESNKDTALRSQSIRATCSCDDSSCTLSCPRQHRPPRNASYIPEQCVCPTHGSRVPWPAQCSRYLRCQAPGESRRGGEVILATMTMLTTALSA